MTELDKQNSVENSVDYTVEHIVCPDCGFSRANKTTYSTNEGPVTVKQSVISCSNCFFLEESGPIVYLEERRN